MKPMKMAASLGAAFLMTAFLMLPASAQEEQPTIAEIATDAGDFTTLVAALDAAGLVDTFADTDAGPFTVFAPTDEAFEDALDALGLTADELLADQDTLTTILQYHVVEGAVPSSDVVTLDGQEVATLSGETVRVTVDGDTVMVNDATVTTVDLEASNGVVHVVDAVLVPPSISGSGQEATSTTAPAPAATEGSDLPDTGVGTGVLALIAVALVGGGALIFVGTRRFESQH